jgi:ribosomal protein S12 methylthiotransferase
VYLNGEMDVKPGDLVQVRIEEADETDLWGERV